MKEGGFSRGCFWFLRACLAIAPMLVQAQAPPRVQIWCRDASGVVMEGAANDAPITVGSLQKPFVAAAWAATHRGASSPRFNCAAQSGCWLPAGHGELNLERALALSCNTYFLHLAREVPLDALGIDLQRAGFLSGPRSAEEAIGLPGEMGPLRVRPSDLLRAYAHLVREPWPTGEAIRREVLAGLRDSALDGTAKGLGHRGFWAKTGTVPASDGNPLHTCGLALAVDDSGWALLARLEPGTGREAAAALSDEVTRRRPWSQLHQVMVKARGPVSIDTMETKQIRVRLFDLLPSRDWELRNLGASPLPTSHGFLGAGGALALKAGDRIGPGRMEIRSPISGARRRFQGSLECLAARRGTLRLIASLTLRDYVEGVVAGELPHGTDALQEELGAAVIRFLAQGPRHADADVCDSTHCALFLGRGPRLDWSDPRHAVLGQDSMEVEAAFSDEAWSRILQAARAPGPHQWTAHCGGEPLSGQALWGNGDTTITPCPRHGASNCAPWIRHWSATQVAKALGGGITTLTIGSRNGTWVLQIQFAKRVERLRYDEAHRRIAAIASWDALPSPADHIEPEEGGYRVTGRGSGHRVGLCLGE